jgi:hypothetical protein
MISTTHRQYMMLGGLLLMFVIIATYQLGTFEPPATAPRTPSTAPARGSTATTARRELPVTDVKLDLLQATREELPAAERNPFRFKPKPPPPAPPVVRNTSPSIVAPLVPTGPPPPPPIPLRVIGVIEGQPRLGIMSDGRGNVFYGKEGDIIDGRYRVLRVGPDSADLSYTDGRGRQTLRMSGQ